MEYRKLPHTDIAVSKICLGTMTFGNQNTEAEGHQQMDYALENGVNFFDTAELYPDGCFKTMICGGQHNLKIAILFNPI